MGRGESWTFVSILGLCIEKRFTQQPCALVEIILVALDKAPAIYVNDIGPALYTEDIQSTHSLPESMRHFASNLHFLCRQAGTIAYLFSVFVPLYFAIYRRRSGMPVLKYLFDAGSYQLKTHFLASACTNVGPTAYNLISSRFSVSIICSYTHEPSAAGVVSVGSSSLDLSPVYM